MLTANGLDLADDLRVHESGQTKGVYHLTRRYRALCGDILLRWSQRALPINAWHFADGMHRYCRECERIALREKKTK